MEILEPKGVITEVKKSLNRLHSRLEIAEKSISKLEDRSIEIIKSEERGGKKELKTNEQDSVSGHNEGTGPELVFLREITIHGQNS